MRTGTVSHVTPLPTLLRAWMTDAGLSAEKVSARMGNVTPQSIRNWRAGHAIPSNGVWRPLAEALGVSVEAVALACIPTEVGDDAPLA